MKNKSVKNKTARVFGSTLLAALASVVCFGCFAFTDEVFNNNAREDNVIQTLVDDPSWTPAVTLFMLKGGTDVTNVKLTWPRRAGASHYEVYRDEVLIGTVAGDTIDDYDLAAGTTYSYSIRAWISRYRMVKSAPVSAAPFTPPGSPQGTKDNYNPTSTLGSSSAPGGLRFGNTWYDYRTQSSGSGSATTVTIQERASGDGLSFGSWYDIGTVTDAKLEGVAFRKVGSKVVLSAHHENGSNYDLGNFFLASIKPSAGLLAPDKFVVTFKGRPFGLESRDQSIFIDEDESAYLVSSTNTNADLAIYLLNDDWTDFAGAGPVNIIMKGQWRETPFILRYGEAYYLFSSRASGWYPSQAKYAVASRLDGQWSVLRELGNAATFGSQFNSVASYGQTYGLYGYRWGQQYDHAEGANTNYPRLMTLAFSGNFATAEYFSEVAYYPSYGLIGIQPGRNLSLGKPARATSASAEYGKIALITDGDDLESSGYFRGGSFPYNVTIDLGQPAVITEINLTTFMLGGSEGAFKYTLEGSPDGVTYTQLADNTGNWKVGFKIDRITNTNPFRYVRIKMIDVINVHNNNSIKSWADGIIELAVLGNP